MKQIKLKEGQKVLGEDGNLYKTEKGDVLIEKIIDVDAMGSKIEINTNDMTATIYFDIDGWDSMSKAYKDIKSFAQNDNDSIADDIEDALNEHSFSIDYDKKHKIIDIDGGEVLIFLKKN